MFAGPGTKYLAADKKQLRLRKTSTEFEKSGPRPLKSGQMSKNLAEVTKYPAVEKYEKTDEF